MRRSSSVSGMEKVHSRMLERARFAIKMFLVVAITFFVRKDRTIAKLPISPNMMTRLYRTIRMLWITGSSLKMVLI